MEKNKPKTKGILLPKEPIRPLPLGEEIILILLATHHLPLYGTQIVELSEGSLNKGSVYVFLSRLEKDGLVTSELEQTEIVASNGRRVPRRYFKLTTEGRTKINAHLKYRHFLGKGEFQLISNSVPT